METTTRKVVRMKMKAADTPPSAQDYEQDSG